MKTILSAPSKCFISGEYGVLEGGPGLLANLKPRFELVVDDSRYDKIPFHPDSPAGKLCQMNPQFFSKMSIQFLDPHNGLGGFGASSAQFLLTYALMMGESQTDFYQLTKELRSSRAELMQLLKVYQSLQSGRAGLPPSGVDVLSQAVGGFSEIRVSDQIFDSHGWPFGELALLFFRTGEKVPTHEHLASLGLGIGHSVFKDISNIAEGVIEAFNTTNSEAFIEGIRDNAEVLEEKGFLASTSRTAISYAKELNGVLAAKGCGAMGADLILVICHVQDEVSVKMLMSRRYEFAGDHRMISAGLVGDQL